MRESRRPHTHRLALSSVVAEGLHHRQCKSLSVVHLGFPLYFYGHEIDIPCEASARSQEAESCRARY
ncbi:hypothetical protein Taro_038634 [Colocasia esculenta]|uniref:Uncharacterized protein n=1 Tax=Colocasia esculenta TaxID=4460 RepID=A0A843WGE3_COLES|nr:hypothetical protein [Colocasia esculenta]